MISNKKIETKPPSIIFLMMATMAAEIKPEDTVISPNFTWVATTNPAKIMGANVMLSNLWTDSETIFPRETLAIPLDSDRVQYSRNGRVHHLQEERTNDPETKLE